MRKAIVLAVALAAVGILASVAMAATNNLKTFADGDADVISAGSKAVLIVGAGGDAGVYKNSPVQLVGRVHFSMTSFGDVQGGAPRFSIPLDTDGVKNTVESYAFLDAANCGGTIGDNPTRTETLVSTDSASCPVFINTGGQFSNWAALVTAHPLWRTAKAPAFIIADVPGEYLIKNISLYS
jgi:hypothetical protein